ncbi:uncharacterized protein LOC122363244 [Amphibalanus amphitrite]|uniref:uncharacterized protein LOC122363244 n=1 Tax=Amphibalanus amphitrite TaxID=1232801 RepID=UPI001C8FDAE4|nr:uncharacterized protein LOC122363244 [Amphibalanus amphitrite]
MAEKDIGLDKFNGTSAKEWTLWLEDYRIFGGLKKWSEEKLVTNLRFFVCGDVKDCIRQKCSENVPKELDEIEKEVARFLGGSLDPISAVHELDQIIYDGSVERTMLKIGELIPLAYPTLSTQNDKQQMVLLHLHKILPANYTRELIKAGTQKLEEAVTVIGGLERADRSVVRPAAINQVKVGGETSEPVKQCYVCGITNHVKAECPFKSDICGHCEKRGHLSTMCRNKTMTRGNGRGPAPRGGRQAKFSSSRPTGPPQGQPGVMMPPVPTYQTHQGLGAPMYVGPPVQYQQQWRWLPPVPTYQTHQGLGAPMKYGSCQRTGQARIGWLKSSATGLTVSPKRADQRRSPSTTTG